MNRRRHFQLGQRILAGLLAISLVLPGPVAAQMAGGPPAQSQAQAGTETKADEKCAPKPAGSAVPLSPQELQACAKALEKTDPALADDVRKAVSRGDLARAQELMAQKNGKVEKEEQRAIRDKTGKADRDKSKKEAKAIVKKPQAPAPKEERGPSLIEAFFASASAEREEKEGLPPDALPAVEQFGYSLFGNQEAAFVPPGGALVGPDYVLGPNDEFTVTVWGLVDGVYEVRVSREGTVVFPKIGKVQIAGITYGELRGHIERAFARHYKNFQLSVTMGDLRGVQVFVVGEVQRPGSYTLDSLSTIYTALFSSGGPTKAGTLRDIRLLRQGKVVKSLDLYDFLLKGDKSQDLRLQDQDTVFVPLIGSVVAVTGEVVRPAIFEIKEPASLQDTLVLAGGVRPMGYLSRVQVERIVAHDRKVAVDLNLSGPSSNQPSAGHSGDMASQASRIPVQNMDFVKVFPINNLMQGVVYLKGHVLRPGPYELKPGMRVSDVLKGPGDLAPEAYPDYARIVRQTMPERAKRVVPFHLQKALAGDPSANLELQNLDEIEIFSKEALKAFPTVTVNGEVREEGEYPLLKDMRVNDLIVLAGGLNVMAYQKQAEITRYEVVNDRPSTKIVRVDLERAIAGDPAHNLMLQAFDSLSVRPAPESDVGRNVTVRGEVRFPGVYSIKRGERLVSVLKRAGGFTDRAFLKGLLLIRETAKHTQQSEVQKFVTAQKQKLSVEIAALSAGSVSPQATPSGGMSAEQAQLNFQVQALEQMAFLLAPGRVVVRVTSLGTLEGTADDVLLEPDDMITVPQQPSIVTILGGVRNSTSVLYRDGLSIQEYVAQAGGLTPQAVKEELYLVRADGSTEMNVSGQSQVEPGDAIVVPTSVEPKSRPVQLWTAIASVLGSLMLAVAAIAVIGR